MVIFLKIILITAFILTCLIIIAHFMDNENAKDNVILTKRIEIYKKREKCLFGILKHIHQQLSLLELKNCPEEEYHNIPKELRIFIEEIFEIEAKR